MSRILSILIIFAFFTVTSGYAQALSEEQVSTGSVYSKVGVGFPVDLGSSSADGMGLTGVSFIEPNVPGLANPAQWGSTVYGMATGGIGLERFKASDNQNSSSNALFSANYFQVQLPLIRNKLGISAAVAPRTRSSFQFSNLDSFVREIDGAQDTLNYISESNSDGGVNMLEMGLGWRITQNISVGYAGSLVFASIDNEFTTDFEREFITVSFTQQTSGIGFGNRFGALFNTSQLFRNGDQLNIGISANLPLTLDAERIEETDKVLPNGTLETIVKEEGPGLGDGNIKLPLSVSAGITYQASRLFSVSTEGLYERWSQYGNDFDVEGEQLLTDRYKLGMGLRYFPYIKGSNRFLSSFKYRLGASYDTGHIKLEGESIETLMFSLGLGILSPNSRSSVDLSFEYGFRGTKDQSLIKENIWGLRLSVNLSELMFFRPKLQ